MNSKVIAGIVVVLILLGIGGYFVASNKSTKTSVSTKMEAKTDTKIANSDNAKSMSFKDLLTAGVSQKCTFSSSTDKTSSEGTVYTSGGKMRGDITTTVNGKTTVTHMMMDSNTSQVWIDGQKQGFTMSLDTKTVAEAQKEGEKLNVDVNQKYNYKCAPSVVSGSMFTLPTGIEFVDLSKMMPQISITGGMMQGGNAKSIQCAMCNNLSGDDKEQCLTSLKCN